MIAAAVSGGSEQHGKACWRLERALPDAFRASVLLPLANQHMGSGLHMRFMMGCRLDRCGSLKLDVLLSGPQGNRAGGATLPPSPPRTQPPAGGPPPICRGAWLFGWNFKCPRCCMPVLRKRCHSVLADWKGPGGAALSGVIWMQ